MIKKTTYGYTIENAKDFLDIQFFDHDIIRFVYSNEKKLPNSSPAIILKPRELEVLVDKNTIETDRLKIVIDEHSLMVKIYDLDGNLISEDTSYKVESINKINKAEKENMTMQEEAKSTAEAQIQSEFMPIELKKKLSWEKGIYGLGEKYGFLNKLGTKTENWSSDVLAHAPLHNPIIEHYHTAIPFYMGLDANKAYGIYHDNTYKTLFDFGKYDSDNITFKAAGGRVDYYFIFGKNAKEIVSKYGQLTGTMPLPNISYLGYQQSRWSYNDRDELMEVAKNMRKYKIPCDVLYLDIDYMENYKVFTVNTKAFYDFKEMLSELKELNYKIVVIIDPGVKKEKGYFVYDEGVKNGYFIKDEDDKENYIGEVWPGESAFPDFMKESVRKWWGDLHKELLVLGVDGIWNDMNEPADASNDEKTLPQNSIHRDDNGNIYLHKEVHNLYGLMEAMSTYDGMTNIKKGERPFILTRAAFAGTQRYAALWTGDNSSVWEHLELSIPMFLNLGLSGYSFVGGDVGGFIGNTNPELLMRWNQLGCFTPFFRNHSSLGTIRQEPWSFGDRVLDNIRDNINERYRLFYHLYHLAYESHQFGYPIMRPVFFEYPKDINAYDLHEQFLLGENMMICPIVRPRIKKKMIYLPEGVWYDYWTNQKYESGYRIFDISEEHIPVFVKSGSAVLKNSLVQSSEELSAEKLKIQVYGDEDFEKTFYFDDGKTNEYKDGKYSLIKIKSKDKRVELESVYDGIGIKNINVEIVS